MRACFNKVKWNTKRKSSYKAGNLHFSMFLFVFSRGSHYLNRSHEYWCTHVWSRHRSATLTRVASLTQQILSNVTSVNAAHHDHQKNKNSVVCTVNKEGRSVLNNNLDSGTGVQANLLLYCHPNIHSLLKAQTYRASVYSVGKEVQMSVKIKSRILSAWAFTVLQNICSCVATRRLLETF